MGAWCENPLDLFRLATFVMSDRIPEGCSAAYLFGHTPDNEVPILHEGLSLYRNENIRTLLVGGGEPYLPKPNSPVAYSGGHAWQRALVANGVREGDVIRCPYLGPAPHHTGNEPGDFMPVVKDKGWESICIVSIPFHMLRAFVSTVSYVLRKEINLRVYARAATTQAWNEVVASSQGVVFGNRLTTLMEAEWTRLNTIYGNEHDLLPAKAILEYIYDRDR